MNRRGFTLIELMISTALAMLLASVATGAFLQVRRTVGQAESRLASYTSAQALHSALHHSLGARQHSCAMVVTTDADSVDLVFVRAKEDFEDYRVPESPDFTSDLTWERWNWDRTTGRLERAVSSAWRTDGVTYGFTPAGGIYLPKEGIQMLPEPRRHLDPSDPFGTGGRLNDPDPTDPWGIDEGLDNNVVFPDPAAPGHSLYLDDDIGDHADLERNRIPVMAGISDLTLQLVRHDGSVTTHTAGSAGQDVIQGVWLDGRMAATLTGTPDYATSPLAKRPRLLRLRYTVTDPVTRSDTTFSFSFALPGPAGAP